MKDKPVAAPGSVGGCPGERLLVVCDFDGTVCQVDMGNAFLERFAEGWEEIDRSYSAGEVGSRAAYSRIAPLFRANRSQVLDFVLRRERLDPFFPEFLNFCRGRKIDLKIVSDGLDVYIEAILRKYGLDVEFYSNRLVFQEEDRIDFAFPPISEECGRCGNCKRSLLGRFRNSRVESWRSSQMVLSPAPPHQTGRSVFPSTAFQSSSSRGFRFRLAFWHSFLRGSRNFWSL